MNFLKMFVCFFLLLSPVFSESSKMVEGIGMAPGSGEGPAKEALAKALRNALERSIGVMVSSESLVKNFQLIEDHIYSNVQGYVKNYSIIEDNKGADGLTRIKVLAEVEKSQLENDLKGIKVILEAKGNPKTLILIDETIDGEPASVVSTEIENFFISKTFPLVDKKQFDIIKSRDAKDVENDPVKAKALSTRYGAQLIITGTAAAKLGGQREAYGIPVFNYFGNLNLKAINADTGDILAVLTQSGKSFNGNAIEAASTAVVDAWKTGNEAFFTTIMEKFRSSVLNVSEMTLIISKLVPQKRTDILTRLKTVDGIMDLNEKSYSAGVCEISLNVDGVLAKNIDEKISSKIPELMLVSKTPNRVDFELTRSEK
ncbi:MAG: hypothetical protein ACD_79C00264G0002 [uncultured bacterium]|nr:MAG: hypothetical protein ACD_79C00264G0002 [uncultured bacterium]